MILSKEDFIEIKNKLLNTYGYLNKKENKELNQIFISYMSELKEFRKIDIINAIELLSEDNKFTPTVSEIKIKIKQQQNIGNANLNSSYFYINLKEHCDENKIPYYDITKGIDYPLPPFIN